jgi:hypothetical protein
MPLHDHFHGPIADRPWESFHVGWACSITSYLNRCLPKELVAEVPIHFDKPLDFETTRDNPIIVDESESIRPAVFSMPTFIPLEVKVEVRDISQARKQLGAIEIVGHDYKKGSKERTQLAAICMSYLGRGISLVVIDIDTSQHCNTHNDMVRLMDCDSRFLMSDDQSTYVTAYRPVLRDYREVIDVWMWPLIVGSHLPVVPLALRGYGFFQLDLESIYRETCERCRIPE